MDAGSLTRKEFWRDYWERYDPLPVQLDNFYPELLTQMPPPGSSFIEIGGFPGNYCAYFKRFFGYDVHMLDYLIIPEVISKVERINNLLEGEIKWIQSDFLTYQPEGLYDVVFSRGFIEHFDNTELILRKHCDLLRPGGRLIITLPNFRGINGAMQWLFDRKNYDAHNIEAMVPSRLERISAGLGLKKWRVFYHGTPVCWLDRPEVASGIARAVVRLLDKLMSRTHLRNRMFSPVIVILGEK